MYVVVRRWRLSVAVDQPHRYTPGICFSMLILLSSCMIFPYPSSSLASPSTMIDGGRKTLRRLGTVPGAAASSSMHSMSVQLKLQPRQPSAVVADRWSSSAFVDPRRRPTSNTQCVRIPDELRLCRNIGYTLMRLPNILEHDSIEETVQQSKAWIHLRDVNCHPDTQLFLCSLFSPVCLEQLILPCRSLCEAVRHGCEPRMQRYGFSWPEMLRCDKFPLQEDLCISMQSTRRTQPPADAKCELCRNTNTFAAVMDKFCSSEFAMVVKVLEISATIDNDLTVIVATRKKNVFRTRGLAKKEIFERMKALPLHIPDGAGCKCTRNLVTSSNETFLTMGRRDNDGQLTVTYLLKINRKSRETRRALRAIAEDNECQNGRVVIETVAGDGDDAESLRVLQSVAVTVSPNGTSVEAGTSRRGNRKQGTKTGNGSRSRNRNRSTTVSAAGYASTTTSNLVVARPYLVTSDRQSNGGNNTEKAAKSRTRNGSKRITARKGVAHSGELSTSFATKQGRKLSSAAKMRLTAVTPGA